MGIVEIIIAATAICLVVFTVIFNIIRRKNGCCGSGMNSSCSDCRKCDHCKNDNCKNG